MNRSSTNQNDLTRKSRSRSISPSVSFDSSQHLTEAEKHEKLFYGAKVKDMSGEIFSAFDDLFKYVNSKLDYNMFRNNSTLKEDKFYDIVDIFLGNAYDKFLSNFDKGELRLAQMLRSKESEETNEYVNNKYNNFIVHQDTYEEDKNNYFNLLKENRLLLAEIDLQEKIKEHQNKNKEKLKEDLNFLTKQIEKKNDSTLFIEQNLEIMENKFKMMRRTLKQSKNN